MRIWRPASCERRQGARGKYWWRCDRCVQVWNERFTGPHWRPYECPARKDKSEAMGQEAYRDKVNHNGAK